MAEHAHGHGQAANARRLGLALALTGTFLIVEVVSGFLFGSLALLSDAGHMLTDVAALALSLFALRLGTRPADRWRTFGYRRAEVLAAALNAAVLFALGLFLLLEAYERLREPVPVQTTPMLLVAVLGLLVNLISARVLAGGSEHSLNVRSAYLEVLGDLLGSAAVIVGALVIRFSGLAWVDPVLAALIGLWVLPRTWTLLRASVNVLLEGVPEGLNLDALRADLQALPGVQEVHDLHVWSVTSGEHNLSAHLVSDRAPAALLPQVRVVAERYGIRHTTVQVEPEGLHTGHAEPLHP
ncbi:cation diffusion facilitator family transporter [Deinococcus sp. YIM 77859]|uniref:cation diffusion facilitator family transporter n=1 Tax=Deinococcus sp. YIM 77859 TaxID=1540221 RepID=UPI0005519BF7|nr:cation diffusion facilitator family transporter [Deinococcus sp. YIM 77859]